MSLSGVLLIDKEEGLTSHGVVEKVRRILSFRRVGHTGTLDPTATGLLPLCLGKATRLSRFLPASDKTYAGTIRFGIATDTHDREGKPLGPSRPVEFTADALQSAIESLRGAREQVPPIFSAKKHGGVPLYRFARRQQDVPRTAVPVTIHHLAVLGVRADEIDFEVKSSPGTYIRVLAHDLGEALGCGAHLQSLRRMACGDFRVEDAVTLDGLAREVQAGMLDRRIIPVERVPLGFPTVVANRQGVTAARHGRALGIREILPSRSSLRPGLCRLESEAGELIAVGRIAQHEGAGVPVVQPEIVFPPE